MTALRWCLLMLGMVVMVGLMVIASLTADPDDWSRVVAWAEARAAKWPPSTRGCPPLSAPALPGDAGALYLRAGHLAEAIDNEHRARFRALLEAPPVALTVDDRTQIEGAANAIAALRDATRREGTAAAFAARDVETLVELTAIVDAMLLQVHDPDAEPAVAAGLLLDALAAGADFVGSGTLMSHLLGSMCIERCADAVQDERLRRASPAVLATLERGLVLAEHALATTPQLADVIAMQAVTFIKEHPVLKAQDLGLVTALQAWRHGFDVRALAMARVGRLVAMVDTFERATPGDEAWRERRPRLVALSHMEVANNGDNSWTWLENLVEGEERQRAALAKMRLLRLAIAFHRAVPLPALADPLGDGGLRCEIVNGTATFCCGPGKPMRVATR